MSLLRLLLACLLLVLAGVCPGKAFASFPSEAESVRQLRCRAVDCELKGDRDSAIDLNRQALNLAGRAFGANSPFLADIYYDIGMLALSDSKFNLAEESFNQSIQLNPNCYPARIKLAELMHIRGQSDAAVKESQTVLSKHRNNVPARAILAISYQDLGKPYKAIRECYFLDQAMRGKNPPAPSLPPAAPPPPSVDREAAEKIKKDAEQAAKDKAAKEKAIKEKAAKEKVAKEKAVKEKTAKKIEKKPAKKPSAESGIASSMESKAILLTPIKRAPKRTAPVQPVEEDSSATSENNAENAVKEIVKPSAPRRPKPAQAEVFSRSKPRSGGGLVPPPPPVVPVYSPMIPVIARPAPVKAKPVEKEKPKEKAPEVKEDKTQAPEEKDDDFLLDWGDAKNKKKK